MKQFFPLDGRAVCSISINDSHQIFNLFLLSYWYFEAHWGLLIFGEQFHTLSVLFYLVSQTAGNLDKSSAHLFLLLSISEKTPLPSANQRKSVTLLSPIFLLNSYSTENYMLLPYFNSQANVWGICELQFQLSVIEKRVPKTLGQEKQLSLTEKCDILKLPVAQWQLSDKLQWCLG